MKTPPSHEGGEIQDHFEKAAALLAEASFPETPEMADPARKRAIVNAMVSGDFEPYGVYQDEAEVHMDKVAPAGDIGWGGNQLRRTLDAQLHISTGLLWAEAGKPNNFGNELLEAYLIATNHFLDDILLPIREALRLLFTPPDNVQEIIAAFKADFGARASAQQYLVYMETASPNGALGDIAQFIISEDIDGTKEQAYPYLVGKGWAKG